MKTTPEHDQKIARITFGSVLPHYIKKIESKGRTQDELFTVIHWLTGYTQTDCQALAEKGIDFRAFFEGAKLNPAAEKITGLICGYRIEEIETPLTRQIRYLDKLVDELAKGKKMDKILRS